MTTTMRSHTMPPLKNFFLLFLLLVAVAAEARGGRLAKHRFEHEGLQRSYLLYTPKGASGLPGKRPLVFAIHGGGGTARRMVRLTKRRFHQLADRDGFYVIYPNAVNKMWDFGDGVVSERLEQRVDDVGYFRDVIDRVVQSLPIDRGRVFATGISRGGQACYFLAAKLPERLRAIAPVAMPIPRFLAKGNRAGAPLPILLINGTSDPIVPYNGGQITVLGEQRGEVLSTDATIDLFRRRNHCTSEPARHQVIDPTNDGTKVVRSDWACPTPVALYRVEDGGHTWPGGRQYLSERLIAKVTRDIDGAKEIWSFFRQLP